MRILFVVLRNLRSSLAAVRSSEPIKLINYAWKLELSSCRLYKFLVEDVLLYE